MSDFPIFDGHNDTLLSLHLSARGGGRSFFERSATGHIDLPRAREGGFGGGFFAIFVPGDLSSINPPEDDLTVTASGYAVRLPDPIDIGHAQRTTLAVMARLLRLVAESAGQVQLVRSADELDTCLRAGILAVVLHFEGAEAIDTDLDALEVFYAAGLRSLGLVWSRPNAFGSGVPFAFPGSPDSGPGLTPAGRELVRACNRLGILVDLAHLTERGFWDVAELSDAPLVTTHAAAHALCAVPRNMTDKQLDAIRETNGVIGVAYEVAFLRADGNPEDTATPLSEIVRHIDYIVQRIGIEHVALGSDFDGATIPTELGDVSGLPKLLDALRAQGYDDDALRKLTSQNWLRVLRRTWR